MMDRDSKNSDAAQRFMWAVQALAVPASEQQRLFPEFAETADELALDHEEAQASFLKVAGAHLSPGQREAVRLLDQQLERMSGPEGARFWTLEALDTAAEWERVRELAVAVLREMGWQHQSPPVDRAIYVGGPQDPDP